MSDIWYTLINRNVIDSNRKRGENEPPIKFQRGKYGDAVYCHSVDLPAVSRLVYSSEWTLIPCGERLVIERPEAPVVVS